MSTFVDTATEYVLNNKLKTVLCTWGAGIGTCLAYQFTQPTPISLKLIHSRVYAQALTLAALGAVAGIEYYAERDNPTVKDKDGY
ncbi:hypothetical protein D9Q98_005465 [Chlorella vulgaris]|uniref:HIG1 domain-containing protein n=1 Tax=Chlorella vulgaris TaxID=3077 RepID=A0A9D4YW83_CHLVU|nr:hypothetical protein D9Q98_005465 [Chlorella vulgaris]